MMDEVLMCMAMEEEKEAEEGRRRIKMNQRGLAVKKGEMD